MLREMGDKPNFKLDLSKIKSNSQKANTEAEGNFIEEIEDLGSISDRKSLNSIKFGLSVKQKLSNGYVGSKLGHEK